MCFIHNSQLMLLYQCHIPNTNSFKFSRFIIYYMLLLSCCYHLKLNPVMSKLYNTWPSITFVRNVIHCTVATTFTKLECLVANNKNRVNWKS